ncbi:hypothetical protein ACFFQW_34615 [Umezawaea endophytica]|uniref:Molecular chaperone GrpE (Heat shock protein) n=1 Tax=Umezawaea endophytica TaxID=1654476 RepID=A0A9X2VK67_9PSEU|nr:hypothetical protein [Umezawaea endophytica]MCS7477594.1 hypothetical protein [Umezawaea endophytica]
MPFEPDENSLAELSGRVGGVEKALLDFHRRSAHRESVIDDLSAENRLLRDGARRDLLKPVVADLIRLYDGLTEASTRTSDRMFASFADDVVLALDRCGIEVVPAEPGEPFEPGRHTVAAVRPGTGPEQHNTVAAPLAAGFRDVETGRMRRLAAAAFYRFDPAPEA